MKKYASRALALLLAAAMIFVFAACNGDGDTTDESTTDPSASTTETTTETTEASTDEDGSTVTGDETTTGTTKVGDTTTAATTKTTTGTDGYVPKSNSKADIIKFGNERLTALKSAKGVTIKKSWEAMYLNLVEVRKANGDALSDGLVSQLSKIVSGLLGSAGSETKTLSSASAIKDYLQPLYIESSIISSATWSGDTYTFNFAKEAEPAPKTAKCLYLLNKSDLVKTHAPGVAVTSATYSYEGCKLVIKVDKKTGNITYMETKMRMQGSGKATALGMKFDAKNINGGQNFKYNLSNFK